MPNFEGLPQRRGMDWTEAAELVLHELERHDDSLNHLADKHSELVRSVDKLTGTIEEMKRRGDKFGDRGWGLFLTTLPVIVSIIALFIAYNK